jgi:hypothetical protein
MPNKKNIDEAKRERALKLLEESDPETAEILREQLKKRNKRKENPRPLGDETEDLLAIHPSFWMNASFIRWQLLKRNKNYEYWAYEFFWDNREFFTNHFAELVGSYRPKEGQSLLNWGARVQQKTFRKLTDVDMQWKLTAKSVVWRKVPKSLPDRWIPIPIEVSFPHPHVLRLLTASTVGLAVTTVPFDDMKEIQLRGRSLWVDLTKTWQEIKADIRSYESLLRINSEREMAETVLEAKKQLAIDLRRRKRNSTPKRNRSRKRDSEPPRIARILAAWDLKQKGKSYAQICKELWPEEASRTSLRDIDGNPSSLLKRARDHVRDAERLIQSAFSG